MNATIVRPEVVALDVKPLDELISDASCGTLSVMLLFNQALLQYILGSQSQTVSVLSLNT
jgi:hypothetical protein